MTADTTQGASLAPCGDCGMPCTPREYHPYAACLMFKACHNSETVRANLDAVRAQAPAPQPPAALVPRYRLLEPGIDSIEPDDEFLKDDGVTWFIDDAGTFVGIVYGGAALLPARRAITGTPNGKQT